MVVAEEEMGEYLVVAEEERREREAAAARTVEAMALAVPGVLWGVTVWQRENPVVEVMGRIKVKRVKNGLMGRDLIEIELEFTMWPDFAKNG
ncbi:hypothetical protein HAX54_030023 [Datura stramonium]|uniref:Uncharacterized protein n=1 Tax=Datura stramonium TaxID=4076 RepID=A0ABS8V9S5_DATST|nr:hypothetical protein [Datura stramonium]